MDYEKEMVHAKVLAVKNCLNEMGNTLNKFYKFVKPKDNVYRYIKVVVRKLKGTYMGEFSSTFQCAVNGELVQTSTVTPLRQAAFVTKR